MSQLQSFVVELLMSPPSAWCHIAEWHQQVQLVILLYDIVLFITMLLCNNEGIFQVVYLLLFRRIDFYDNLKAVFVLTCAI